MNNTLSIDTSTAKANIPTTFGSSAMSNSGLNLSGINGSNARVVTPSTLAKTPNISPAKVDTTAPQTDSAQALYNTLSSFKIDTSPKVTGDAISTTVPKTDIYATRASKEAELRKIQTEQAQRAKDYMTASEITPEEKAAQERLLNASDTQRQYDFGTKLEQNAILNKAGLSRELTSRAASEIGLSRQLQSAQNSLETLAASESLQALTGVRTSKLDALKTRMGFEDTRFEKLLGLESTFANLDKTDKQQARQDIADVLTMSQGLEWDQLPAETQQSITAYAANSPFTIPMIKQALTRNAIALKDEQAKNAADIAYTQAQTADKMGQTTSTGSPYYSLPKAVDGTNGLIVIPKSKLSANEQTVLRQTLNANQVVNEAERLYKEAVGSEYSGIGSGVISHLVTGPIIRWGGSVVGANPAWEAYKNYIDSNMTMIAKGLKGEVGNLTEQDYARAIASFPAAYTTPKVSTGKFSSLRGLLSSNIQTLGDIVETDENLRQQVINAGYDYDSMKADGASDKEIKSTLKLK